MVRLKHRYFVVEIVPQNPTQTPSLCNEKQLNEQIVKNILKYYGVFGEASIRSGFSVKYCNEKTNIAIIRARHGPHRFVGGTLPLMNVINGVLAKFKIIYTGATIKQCNKHIIKYHQDYIDRLVGSNGGFLMKMEEDDEDC